ncbi:MAG: hypothetical protein OEV99_17765, partial [Nitrospira sp.]|nr:hypothetical protein [Nitrospira sp.]
MPPDSDAPRGLTRRELVRLLGTSAGLACLAPLAGCGSFWERQAAIPVDNWHKGVCRFCGTGCGVMIGLKDNKVA